MNNDIDTLDALMEEPSEEMVTDAETAPETHEEASEERQEDSEDMVAKELETLRAQVSELTELLAKKQAEAEKIEAQLGDFYSLFPDTAVDALPDEVWEDVKKGNSLAASYAIYQRKMQLQAERIKKVNEKNASLSAGKAGTDAGAEFYSPDEVRAMSREEVRTNYSKIIRSMQKWN